MPARHGGWGSDWNPCDRYTSRKYIRMAADSTILRMVNRLMALSLGVHREQFEHRMGLTWPRPARSSSQHNSKMRMRCWRWAHTLLVAAVILSLLDHFVGFLSVLVLKRLCGGRARRFRISARIGKPGGHIEVPHFSTHQSAPCKIRPRATAVRNPNGKQNQLTGVSRWGPPKSSSCPSRSSNSSSLPIKRIFTTSTDC